MKIRAHHLLCMQNFQGKGYSREFVKNFYDVLSNVTNNKISVVDSIDDICSACPHNKNGCKKKSDSEKRVKEFDDRVAKLLKININETMKIKDIYKRINGADRFDIENLCKDCEWKQFCW